LPLRRQPYFQADASRAAAITPLKADYAAIFFAIESFSFSSFRQLFFAITPLPHSDSFIDY
jgi:hypothetical protein